MLFFVLRRSWCSLRNGRGGVGQLLDGDPWDRARCGFRDGRVPGHEGERDSLHGRIDLCRKVAVTQCQLRFGCVRGRSLSVWEVLSRVMYSLDSSHQLPWSRARSPKRAGIPSPLAGVDPVAALWRLARSCPSAGDCWPPCSLESRVGSIRPCDRFKVRPTFTPHGMSLHADTLSGGRGSPRDSADVDSVHAGRMMPLRPSAHLTASIDMLFSVSYTPQPQPREAPWEPSQDTTPSNNGLHSQVS